MKTIQQVADRITALEARAKDGINVTEELDALEEIKVIMEDVWDQEDVKNVLKEYCAWSVMSEYYWVARIYLWALE